MRFLLLILTLSCLAISPALAQNGQGNGNANGQDNGNGSGQGNGNGNGQNNGNGNGNNGGTGNSTGEANRPGAGQGNGNGAESSTNSDAEGAIPYTQDQARDAVSAGKAVSLASLLPDLQERAGGEVIDAELLNVQGILVYSVKVLRTDGRVTEEYYYAQSGRFIGSEP